MLKHLFTPFIHGFIHVYYIKGSKRYIGIKADKYSIPQQMRD
ncbi:hypothetical protein TREVI0001_1331 [Treponema vincentii ATCC 35580]|uniref:Uncharacterized protein n=1 Tax=Treponema vincentii ATCC 35580 TaxID=596324 RepID=C8PSG4_9SPIR|nr:hypothetical protein TREVI0001_1331 [Treponema vincentii ATCC 35580]